ncbi:hydrolase [Streptomyces sp. SCSIO 30461]|uniref:hydrolase n=1 Tax=Streptomyces sp. SCSIO 30461 TaxID=3118085 RepID=UPI0030CE1C9B
MNTPAHFGTEPGRVVERGVAVPSLDPTAVYDVTSEDGVFTAFKVTGAARTGAETELWPGYTETHAHISLPPNWDDTVDDPRITALQYLYHGVTHIVDMFGYPLLAEDWEAGRAASPWPYPELVHCGYAVTAVTNAAGLSGHGVEFPAPVHLISVEADLDHALRSNTERGGTFLKVMFTDGTEQPGSPVRFSRLSERVMRLTAKIAAERGVTAVIDCNTLEETLFAYACGFRLFAHSVRDKTLTPTEWEGLAGARFVSTLAGLRSMIMSQEDFLTEYGREGFRETQDPYNLEYVERIEKPFGIEYGCQETRTAALRDMRNNALASLRQGNLLIGTDAGNLGAYHGYSFLGELDALRGDDTDRALAEALRHQATVGGRRYFDEMSGNRSSRHPLTVGASATYNLHAPGRPLSALPLATVVQGVPVDRPALAHAIAELRSNDSKGKAAL